MKNLWKLCSVIIVAAMTACNGLKERTIEMPDLDAANAGNIDVRRIQLTDSTTVLTFHVDFRPKWWIKIAGTSKIVANGKEYGIIKSDGIVLDEKFNMPESGETEFTLTFPAIPLDTKKIDYSEGTSDGWQIWGIDISGKPAQPAIISRSLPKNLRTPDTGNLNLTPAMKAEETVLNLHLLDYRPDYGNNLTLRFSGICETSEKTITLDSLGNGTCSATLYGPTWIKAYLSSLGNTITLPLLIEPGTSTDIYIDPKASVTGQMQHRDSSFVAPGYIFDNGKYAGFNREIAALADYKIKIYDRYNPIATLNSSPNQYTDSVLARRQAIINKINSSSLSETLKSYALAQADASTIEAMSDAPHIIANNYYFTHPTGQRVPLDSLNRCLPGDEQYARVAQLVDLDNPLLPLCENYWSSVYQVIWSKYKPSTKTDEMRRYVQLFDKASKGQLADFEIREAERMSDPFFADALKKRNRQASDELAEIKKLVEPLPDVAPQKLFEEIIAPHKGKVILVDIWNTWCSPCRSALKNNEPLKNGELADDDIVWIYIADMSSDINAYRQLLPEIKGLHYLVSMDQIDAIRKQFKVDGIPYYILVNRQGKPVGCPEFRDHRKLVSGIKSALAGS